MKIWPGPKSGPCRFRRFPDKTLSSQDCGCALSVVEGHKVVSWLSADEASGFILVENLPSLMSRSMA